LKFKLLAELLMVLR